MTPETPSTARADAALPLDAETAASRSDGLWEEEILPQLVEYVRIPNKSPHFDADWASAGHMERAVELIERWCRAQPIEGLSVEVVRLEGRTPLIYMEVPGAVDDTVLLYGHLDKQPEMTGWREGLGPWNPVRDGDRLYGRGGADDGYAAFASLTAIRLLQEQGVPHARCVILIEACEESGSYDLPFYIDALAERIGEPSLVVCLDSGCGNYDQLWSTTSLRGILVGDLTVELLSEGVHSGDASGIVPDSFRVLRALLSRIEDEETGEILVGELKAEVPAPRVAQAKLAAEQLGDEVYTKFPFLEGARPAEGELHELVLGRTWRPTLTVVGASGFPPVESAGNVARPSSTFKLSVRLAPTADPDRAARALKERLESDPPHGARVTVDFEGAGGWDAPPLAEWLKAATERASQTYFGRPAVYMGEGGSIPFMGMLGAKFPNAQFLITGLLGPHSNAHGPNEFLHVPTGKRLTCCVAHVLGEHAAR